MKEDDWMKIKYLIRSTAILFLRKTIKLKLNEFIWNKFEDIETRYILSSFLDEFIY